MTIYVNAEGWARRGQQIHHFWADTEAEMHEWAGLLGFTEFFPSEAPEAHRAFRHYLLTLDQMALAVSCGAVVTERWAITRFVANRTLMRETDPELLVWAMGMLDKLSQAGHG